MSLTLDNRKIRGTASEQDWTRIELDPWILIRIFRRTKLRDLHGILRINTAKVWKTFKEILVPRYGRPSVKS
jgi:hypothetical protein